VLRVLGTRLHNHTMSDFEYRCQNSADVQCAEACVGLDACQDCECAVVVTDAGGPWGNVMDVRATTTTDFGEFTKALFVLI
jgi:hypothetical protein